MPGQELSQHLAASARDIQSGHDVAQAADEIVEAAAEMVGTGAQAGITLVHRGRNLSTAAATSDLVRDGDRLQYELRQGPCLDAAWEEEQVYSGDLANDERWPQWGPQVVRDLEVKSMLCTQLFTNESQLGALNIYADEPFAFDAEDKETALLLAAHAAVAVAAAQEIETLKIAVDRRTTIGKALGIVMARYDVDDDRAMAVLRRLSSHENRKLYEVALDIIRDRHVPHEDSAVHGGNDGGKLASHNTATS